MEAGPGRLCENFAEAGILNHGNKDEEEFTPGDVSWDRGYCLLKLMILIQLRAGAVVIPEEQRFRAERRGAHARSVQEHLGVNVVVDPLLSGQQAPDCILQN